MAKTQKTTAKADIDFEQHLWDAPNEMRGAVAENQYKDYVLSLLFDRDISERYTERKEELITLSSDEQSEYFTKSKKEPDNLLNEELGYQVKNVYKLPEEATWKYLRANAEQDDIKVKVEKAFVLIDDISGERKEDYKGVLQPMLVKSQLSATQTAGLINLYYNRGYDRN